MWAAKLPLLPEPWQQSQASLAGDACFMGVSACHHVGTGQPFWARGVPTEPLFLPPLAVWSWPMEHWWQCQVALGLKLPGVGPWAHCSDMGKEGPQGLLPERTLPQKPGAAGGVRRAPPTCMKTHGLSQICCQCRELAWLQFWSIWLLKILVLHQEILL